MDSFDLHRNGNDSNLEYSIANYRFFCPHLCSVHSVPVFAAHFRTNTNSLGCDC